MHGRGEERKKVYKALMGNPEVKGPLGRARRRWENGIRMGVGEIRWGCGVAYIKLAHDRDRWLALVNAVMNVRVLVPQN
jgi:hypothetical protein